MLIETLVTLIAAAAPAKPPPLAIAPASLFWRTPTPAYAPEKRAVDNWRVESALWLDMKPLDAARRALDAEDGEPARCVKLNNYWCVKSAGWNGEIAADADGHVAFASAEEGAAVAALLLRRYYVDYKRHSARAIVERWAPAQCSLVIARATPPAAPRSTPIVAAGQTAKVTPASRAGMMRMLPQRIVPMGLAPRGLQNTLRARWLAAHGRGDVGWGARRARPGTPDLIPAPSIMAGVSEALPKRAKPLPAPLPEPNLNATASLAALPPPLPPLPSIGSVDCSGELARIGNYAAHVSEGIAATPNDDLALFDADGQPTDNLAKALVNMAAVEIGPARPRGGLVTAAVAQLKRLLDQPATPGAGAPEATSRR
ncbi:hypothetical protein OGR47_06135 [Methylocystis sp. MJC1]|jgi:hypothetical protein|uniref:hypothetical protein n=1 Tax=Methylocystis sp. MJC1 TaxID=2654282 RepID=UPI0013EDE683|nr:hypothetical protein [Methylocystis sp. MJC1]KAF2992611.1 hypothetical protein MJC1_00189 [Methylocystis sp. MJC1]MBU6526578.1 hypothetical protein [Methylocystis sp. MJC1]UZX13024.1 hypothetical protein OGR47_06135 [Methylocystis sp. MJC1]